MMETDLSWDEALKDNDGRGGKRCWINIIDTGGFCQCMTCGVCLFICHECPGPVGVCDREHPNVDKEIFYDPEEAEQDDE